MTRIALALLAAATAAPLGAQAPERAVFLVRRGTDTLAVERSVREAARAEGRLLLRAPVVRLEQELALGDSGLVRRVTSTVRPGASGDSVAQRVALTLAGDSMVVEMQVPRATGPGQRLPVARGAVPYINLSGLSLENLLRRARALGGDSVEVPVLLVSGQSLPVRVTRRGADSLVAVIGGVTLRARTDAQGRLLGAVVPSQDVVFERLPGDSPTAAWSPVAAPTSYAPPPGAPYTAEEVVVRTPAGLKLAGTLTLPARRPRVRVPAVVLITGSGAQDRDEGTPELPGWRPFRAIADTLSRRGVAVLRLDDRGIGGSDAGTREATSADLAEDVRAAVAWLRTRPEVDPARVGLVGHSEGAIIAPMVAVTDPRLRGLVLIAGTATRGREVLAEQRRYLLGRDTTLTPARRDSLLAASAREADSAFAAPGWLRFFADYDPLPTARRVRVPTLVLQGETDRQVPAVQATMLAAALRAGGNRRVTLRTFPRMNHLLVEDPTGDPLGYRALPDLHVRKDLLGALADWLARSL